MTLDPRCGFVFNVYTQPAHRKQGLGRRLMDAMHEWCRSEGIERVVLNASTFGHSLYDVDGLRRGRRADDAPAAVRFFRLAGLSRHDPTFRRWLAAVAAVGMTTVESVSLSPLPAASAQPQRSSISLTPCHIDLLAEQVLCGVHEVFVDRDRNSGAARADSCRGAAGTAVDGSSPIPCFSWPADPDRVRAASRRWPRVTFARSGVIATSCWWICAAPATRVRWSAVRREMRSRFSRRKTPRRWRGSAFRRLIAIRASTPIGNRLPI